MLKVYAASIGFLKRLGEEAFPFPFYISRKRKKILEIESISILNQKEFSGYITLETGQLKRRLKEEHNRASLMDEKTFKMTLSLSAGLTVLGSTSAFLVKEVTFPTMQLSIAVVIGISLVYILSAGFIAIGSLRTLPSYGYGTDLLLQTPQDLKECLASSLAKQESMNIVRHLRNEAAYQSLRDGLIFLFTAFAMFSASMAYETMEMIFGTVYYDSRIFLIGFLNFWNDVAARIIC